MRQSIELAKPPYRRLRVFAFDPGLAARFATASMNEVIVEVPLDDTSDNPMELGLGPVDEYVEVVDYDPASKCFYPPVDLNHPYILAQDGVPPSETDPRFHQQMVYAVVRKTIHHFEQALGRRVLWATHLQADAAGQLQGRYLRRLRIYPHAVREANAFYSPEAKSLLFGYFSAAHTESDEIPRVGMVFTCLSHGIIAHETTHALLDGIRQRFTEPTNPDVLAFHEAFADLVALFEHFTYPEVLRHQIAQTRGDLRRHNVLGMLAHQFGQAIGRPGALRNALGEIDEATGEWIPRRPRPGELEASPEPHQRGAILVAAVFDAYLKIYQSRVEDLLRIATGGTGVLPEGAIHPDLVNRMAEEAAACARHLLHVCIRAVDYCPPVDLNFGDYLRALITADMDLTRDDRRNYRVAVIESFRRYGIYPRDVRSLFENGLRWRKPDRRLILDPVRTKSFRTGPFPDRRHEWKYMRDNARRIHRFLSGLGERQKKTWEQELFIPLCPVDLASIHQRKGVATLEVHSVRTAERQGPEGASRRDLVIELTQRRRGYFDPERQRRVDAGAEAPGEGDFTFRGGCTLIVDAGSGQVRYAVAKSIRSDRRLRHNRRFFESFAGSLNATYFGAGLRSDEPFALLHRAAEDRG